MNILNFNNIKVISGIIRTGFVACGLRGVVKLKE